MAIYEVTLTVDEKLKATIEKKLKRAFGKDVPVHTIDRSKTPETRAQRLGEARDEVESARMIIEELKGEMENWKESIPENLQNGAKADEVQESIDALETLNSELENIDFDSVNFPSMF
jgi:hypothetical protein